jgi:hypothetical protein
MPKEALPKIYVHRLALGARPVKFLIEGEDGFAGHHCRICGSLFRGPGSQESASECEKKGSEPFKYQVGDAVLVKDTEDAYPYAGKTVTITRQVCYPLTHEKEYGTYPQDSYSLLPERSIERKLCLLPAPE